MNALRLMVLESTTLAGLGPIGREVVSTEESDSFGWTSSTEEFCSTFSVKSLAASTSMVVLLVNVADAGWFSITTSCCSPIGVSARSGRDIDLYRLFMLISG